jgi:hypothetical protein
VEKGASPTPEYADGVFTARSPAEVLRAPREAVSEQKRGTDTATPERCRFES